MSKPEKNIIALDKFWFKKWKLISLVGFLMAQVGGGAGFIYFFENKYFLIFTALFFGVFGSLIFLGGIVYGWRTTGKRELDWMKKKLFDEVKYFLVEFKK